MPAGRVLAYKVVLAGDAKVGKSSILTSWTTGTSPDYYLPTVSPELTTKDIDVKGCTVRLQVWDMGFGGPDTTAQFPRYVSGAAGAVLMYDTSDVSSVDNMKHWHQQISALAGPKCAFVVVGNKTDLPPADGVLTKARNFCDSISVEHIETCAQTNKNAARVFETLARELNQQAIGGAGIPTDLPTPLHARPPHSSALLKSVKLVLLGDPGVGKSSLAQRLGGSMMTPFQEDYVPTAGPEIHTRQLVIKGIPMKLQVWDASGQDLINDTKICTSVMKGMDAAVIAYDVTAQASFDSLGKWLQLVEAQAGPKIAVMIIGNKADAIGRVVPAELGHKHCEALCVPFTEFSARQNMDVTGLLGTLLEGDHPPPRWAAAVPASPVSTVPSVTADSAVTKFGAKAKMDSKVTMMLREKPSLAHGEDVKIPLGGPKPAAREIQTNSMFAEKAAELRAVHVANNADATSITNTPAATHMTKLSSDLLKNHDVHFHGHAAATTSSSSTTPVAAMDLERKLEEWRKCFRAKKSPGQEAATASTKTAPAISIATMMEGPSTNPKPTASPVPSNRSVREKSLLEHLRQNLEEPRGSEPLPKRVMDSNESLETLKNRVQYDSGANASNLYESRSMGGEKAVTDRDTPQQQLQLGVMNSGARAPNLASVAATSVDNSTATLPSGTTSIAAAAAAAAAAIAANTAATTQAVLAQANATTKTLEALQRKVPQLACHQESQSTRMPMCQGSAETEQDGNVFVPGTLTARMLAQNETHTGTPQGTPQGTPKSLSRIPSTLTTPTLSFTGYPPTEPMKNRTSLGSVTNTNTMSQSPSQSTFSRGTARPVLSSGGQIPGNAGRVTNAGDINSSPTLLSRATRDPSTGVFFQQYSQMTLPGGRIQPTTALSSHISHHGLRPPQQTRNSTGIARQAPAGASEHPLTHRAAVASSPRSCMSF